MPGRVFADRKYSAVSKGRRQTKSIDEERREESAQGRRNDAIQHRKISCIQGYSWIKTDQRTEVHFFGHSS